MVGADIYANDDEALKNAAELGHLDIVEFLICQGATQPDLKVY